MSKNKNVDPEKMARLARAMYKWSRYEEEQSSQKLNDIKSDLESQREYLEDQLKQTRQLLDLELHKTITSGQFTMSSEGLTEINNSFERILKKAIANNKVSPEMHEQLSQLIAHALDTEREKIVAREKQLQGEEIEMLKKKIDRLSSKLNDTQNERDAAMRWAAAVGDGQQLPANIYEAGLSIEDPNVDRKKELMKEIYEANLEIRRILGMEVNTSKDLETAVEEAKHEAPEPHNTDIEKGESIVSSERVEIEENQIDVASQDQMVEIDEETAMIEEPGAILTNPDDMPWEPENYKNEDGENLDSSSVKKISSVKKFAPPPLERSKNKKEDINENNENLSN